MELNFDSSFNYFSLSIVEVLITYSSMSFDNNSKKKACIKQFKNAAYFFLIKVFQFKIYLYVSPYFIHSYHSFSFSSTEKCFVMKKALMITKNIRRKKKKKKFSL